MSRLRSCLLVACLLLAAALPVGAQQPAPPSARPAAPSSDDLYGPQVSLAAERVLDILRAEPALLLHFKRLLVRHAWEQGRLLEEHDLSDDAVFRLVRADERIRALASAEIEARGYITLRPTAEEAAERERQALLRAERQRAAARLAEGAGYDGDGEEDGALPPRRARQPVPPDREERRPGRRPSERLPRIAPDDLPALLAAAAEEEDGAVDSRQARSASLLSSAPPASLEPRDAEWAAASGRASARDSSRPDLRPRPAPRRSEVDAEPSPIRRRANPYADVPSLYDLYAQAAPRRELPERFGREVFGQSSGQFDDLPMDLPAGPDYVLGPGDGLNIELWGGVSQRLQRTVDRQGRIALPEVGTVQVAGRSLGEVQHAVQSVLRTQFRDVAADLSLTRLRTVRVYVVGDVERPGPYDISSLSTPLNALYAAGGPTARGSLRTVRHYRGRELVQEVDLYDLMLRGLRSDVERLEPGDSVLVPPAGAEITVEGMVRRPAIYEVRGERSLAEALELAGGVLPSGALRRIEVERIEAHARRTMLHLELPAGHDREAGRRALEEFAIQDGDRIRISPIVPYSEQTVYLDGHVFRPGKYAWREGMRVSELIGSYADLLPEPSARHAEIIRLAPPDFRPVVLSFRLSDVLAGDDELLTLQPFDTVRVFGRYDFEDEPRISVAGEVRDPGEHRTYGETRLRDAVYLAGGVTPDAMLEDVQVFRRGTGSRMQVFSLNLARALEGDPEANLLLRSRDRVIVHRNLARLDPPSVYIQGEVAKPGRYPLADGLRASELVRLAGGLKRSAYTERADLSRSLQDGQKVSGDHREVELARALGGEAEADILLRDGDTLTIRQLAGWQDIGAAVAIGGEVVHAGTYGIRPGERLSQVLRRAGGFRPGAYPPGAVLERQQVREMAEKTRAELIRRIETTDPQVAAGQTGEGRAALVEAFAMQRRQVLERLRSDPVTGRQVIRITGDVGQWERTADDIELRAGDTLFIPKQPNFVLVGGQVYSPSAISFSPGKSAGWYLRRAGGATEMANRKAIFVVRADGSVVGREGGLGWWRRDVLSLRLQPGDSIVVPEKVMGGAGFWRTLVEAAQVTSSVAIAARVATSF